MWCHQPKKYSIALAIKPLSFWGVLGLDGTTWKRTQFGNWNSLHFHTSLWACVAWYAAVSGRMFPRLLFGIVVVSELATVDCSLSITDWMKSFRRYFQPSQLLTQHINTYFINTRLNSNHNIITKHFAVFTECLEQPIYVQNIFHEFSVYLFCL